MGKDYKKIELGKRSDYEEGKLHGIEHGDELILVTKTQKGLCVCGGECPHYGAPLHEGSLEGTTLTCPWHNARFDVESGKVLDPPALDDLETYRVEGDEELSVTGKTEPRIPRPGSLSEKRFVLVGAGASANAAAEMLRREGFDGHITLITSEKDKPYDRTIISKGLISGAMPEKLLRLRGDKFYKELKIDIQTGLTVTEVDGDNRTVICENGKNFEGDAILLATGGMPKKLDVPGIDSADVYTVRSAEGARKIKKEIKKKKRVAIIGAGFIGMELAVDLARGGWKVSQAAPEKGPMAILFGERIADRIRSVHDPLGITSYFGNTLEKIESGSSGELELFLSGGETITADAAIIAIGIEPKVGFLEKSGFTVKDGIPVARNFETEKPGIYACGDIALYPYRHISEPVRIEHWVEAERQGQAAARGMVGKQAEEEKAPFFWTKQGDFALKYVGFPLPYDQIAYRGKVETESFLAGFYRNDKLIGAASFGMQDEFIEIEEVITQGVKVTYDDFGRSEI
jgi:NADPH-dependent 2,4-dienoyl-CoA reductase/sulfur reductase-like enzyme/nitrite reductase/ring-hydroxylating ferredoxin subunit